MTTILDTPPHKLTVQQLAVLRHSPRLLDRYNAKWSTAFY